MDCFVNTSLCLVVALTRAAESFAGNAVALDNPYKPIVTRNVFDLNPSMSVASPVPTDPLPIITPNGITSILGNVQVLFKATGYAPGQPAREKTYMMGEGQREDDITVTKIDEKNAIIIFDNHGNAQEIRLVAATTVSGAPTAPGIDGQPIFPNPVGLPDGSRFLGAAPLTSGNRMIDNDGTIPNQPGFGAGGYGRSSHNNPSYPGSNIPYGGGVDNNNSLVQDPAVSSGTSSDGNNNSDQRSNFSVAEHLADEQMVLFAKQHMQ
jgi:hypothetical protein